MQEERVYTSAQEAFDDALERAAQGIAQTVKLKGIISQTVTIPPLAVPVTEKILLPKPHPEGCSCPKCLQGPPLPEGVHLLPSGKVRVGDADKDHYLDRLRAAYGDGRLTDDEFTARQNAVLAAATFSELDLLCRDLPVKKEPAVIVGAKKEKDISDGLNAFRFITSLVMTCFPFMAGIGIIGGGALVTSAVLAIIGGFAALLMVIFGGFFR